MIKLAPKSYLNRKRPSLTEAIKLELADNLSLDQAIDSLEKKGYYTPRPRPWQVGVQSRGLGHKDFAVLDRFGDLVAKVDDEATAELIVSAVNAVKQTKRTPKQK